MATRSKPRRVAKEHQFLVIDRRANQYLFHDGTGITSRPIKSRTIAQVRTFYEDYLGWPVYDTSEDEDMEDSTAQTAVWLNALRAIQRDRHTKLHGSTINALTRRGWICHLPDYGFGLTPDGEAYLESHADVQTAPPQIEAALDEDAPRDFLPATARESVYRSALDLPVIEAAMQPARADESQALATVAERTPSRGAAAIAKLNGHRAESVEIPQQPEIVGQLRGVIWDLVELHAKGSAPHLLPALESLRRTE